MSLRATTKRKSIFPDNESQRKQHKNLQIDKTRKKIVQCILNDLQLLYKDLNHLIGDYDSPTTWEKIASTSWDQKNDPSALLGFQQHLCICLGNSNSVLTCNTNGEIMQENSALRTPCAIDIDETNSMLYIADVTHITILNIKLQFLSSWNWGRSELVVSRGLKVDGDILYLSIYGFYQIFLCNSQDGKLLKEYGSGLHDLFGSPDALTVDNKYVYICGYFSHSVQILTKQNGVYVSKWGTEKASTKQGEFDHPNSIYNHMLEDLIYVGDRASIQIFRKDGFCIQRLGDQPGNQMNQFNMVSGICVMDDRLYVSDSRNHRILIFNPL